MTRPLTIKEGTFNYRLSSACRVSENAFRIMLSRFRVYENPIPLELHKVDQLIKATCVLHIWLSQSTTSTFFWCHRWNAWHRELGRMENGGKWKQKELRTPISYTATTTEEIQVMYETSMLKCFVYRNLFHGSECSFNVVLHTQLIHRWDEIVM